MIMNLKQYVRNIPDFPVKGIQFKDVTTLFKEAKILQELSDMLYDKYRNCGITKVAGIESRGFIMGPLLAVRLGAGFIPIRKPGKLPAAVYEESYSKEYGTDAVQIHKDAISEGETVLLHDDLLATGGTMAASIRLLAKFNPRQIYVNCLIELEELNGRATFAPDVKVDTIIKY
ncbi:MAG: adenine phosphoribosyltransferase [Dysgonamonadaceae bacterium]|jgi:adenine phosphoribosyltransferase|nr:adenine phosphoribosyltransferase [Dysgonamonadaceae bacterium]